MNECQHSSQGSNVSTSNPRNGYREVVKDFFLTTGDMDDYKDFLSETILNFLATQEDYDKEQIRLMVHYYRELRDFLTQIEKLEGGKLAERRKS
jgi:hypothetical protein